MNNIILFIFAYSKNVHDDFFVYRIAAAWRKQQLLVYAVFFLLLTLI